ncbi:ABC transporter permease [Rhizobium rhizogenes]|uniref:ABC transporter permease n=1 Tax=Rhizobium rhizogenes TaxID=359 RepID=UPI0015746309|nr:ABC transporter permease [Rhizobium rhizogenes]NTI78662.1 ABC transporter permease [Rhizobium rhizogenes]
MANHVLEVGSNAKPVRPITVTTRKTGRRSALGVLLRNPMAVAGIVILLSITIVAVLASVVAPGDPMAMAGTPLLWPGEDAAFPLGTDSLGRDVWAGIAHGARISLLVGVAATTLSFVLGVAIGATAGYFGGWIDDLIVRFIEIFQTIPGFVLLVVLVAFAQPSFLTVVLGIALVSWDTIARLTRAEFRSLREKDFVTAARSVGYSDGKIILREIIPNALPPLIVSTSIMVASAILMESALSFMGLADPNTATWGSMIGTGREMIRTHWYLTAIPGAFIVATVLSLNLIGDGLNDALNPRSRQ